MTVRIIITLLLLVVILIGCVGLKVNNNRLKKDPHYQRKLAERQAEERRKKAAERELAESMDISGYDL